MPERRELGYHFAALQLQSRRDPLPFGEAEQQARATDSSDG